MNVESAERQVRQVEKVTELVTAAKFRLPYGTVEWEFLDVAEAKLHNLGMRIALGQDR